MAPKQVKSAGDSDRIGGLPDAILSHILSFLPTKEAIRTTVLSPRWRYLFASMSTFDFTDCLKRMTPKNGNNFKNFVDRLLSFPNPVSLESFGLLHPGWEKDDSHLYGWISAILSRGVKQLDLCTPVSSMLSSHMFNSQSLVSLKLNPLVSLKLNPNGFIEVPAKICLPNLKTLFLIEITIVDDSIFRLISSCNVLEELVLTPISDDLLLVSEIIIRNPSLKSLILNVLVRTPKHVTHVEIDAPNLVRLDYSDDLVERYTLSNMESLEKAYIKINYSGEHDPTYLLQAMHNVQALHLSVDLDTTFSQTGLEPVFAFNNLVELELVSPLGEWLVEFLHGVPNLKTLILFQVLAAEGFKFIPRKLPSCLSFHLKEITFTDYKIRKLMFETICYFLNHALVLEKLRVSIVKEYYPREETCVFKMLLRLLRFSIDNQYSIELSSSVKKLLRLFRIGINELYSREESSIIKKLLRLPRGRAIEVSVELKEEM